MRRAESPIGRSLPNSLKRAGFTLIETLLAAAILAAGALWITPAFFKSADILTHLDRRYEADLVAGNLITEKEEELRAQRALDTRPVHATADGRFGRYAYDLEIFPQDTAGFLYLVTVRIRWKDSLERTTSRSAYILQ